MRGEEGIRKKKVANLLFPFFWPTVNLSPIKNVIILEEVLIRLRIILGMDLRNSKAHLELPFATAFILFYFLVLLKSISNVYLKSEIAKEI